MLARAAAQAVVALLLSGALVTRGPWRLLKFWDWAIPYLALFLAVELALRRRQGGPARVFGLGAAFGFLYEGVYTKTVIDGLGFLGVDTAALAASCFDWGMLAVMAAHVLSARFPRRDRVDGPDLVAGLPALGVLSVLGLVMGVIYFIKSYFGHYVAERMVGPTWLVTDVVFVVAAFLLARRVLERDPYEPPTWAYLVGGLLVWMPGNQILWVWGEEFSWPMPVTVVLAAVWAAGVVLSFRTLWVGRAHVEETPRRASPVLLYAVAWRVIGSVALLAAYAPAVFDERAAAAYAVLIDIPSRAAFCYAFLASRLDV
jgi:hypothetical protein